MNPQQILEECASANPIAKAELERMRSELRQAYADRAQARGINDSVSQLIRNVDHESEALISTLDSSGSLDSEATQRAAYKLRLAVAQAIGDEARVIVARESLDELHVPDDESDNSERPAARSMAENIGNKCPASIEGGLIHLEDGTCIDLLKIQQTCNEIFQDTGDHRAAQAADDLSELTGVWQGPHGDWHDNVDCPRG